MCQTDIFSSPAIQFLFQLEVKFVYIFRDHSDNLFPVSPNTHTGFVVPLLPPLTPSHPRVILSSPLCCSCLLMLPHKTRCFLALASFWERSDSLWITGSWFKCCFPHGKHTLCACYSLYIRVSLFLMWRCTSKLLSSVWHCCAACVTTLARLLFL